MHLEAGNLNENNIIVNFYTLGNCLLDGRISSLHTLMMYLKSDKRKSGGKKSRRS